ncbi:aldo/keto reductase [Planctomycetota bacterium]|nr:aldo/keto reductase [Planctomycetota bacterium]
MVLGRTGLRVSVLGLGGGGHSRLGLNSGGDEASAERLVRTAIDLGLTFIDTAEAYGTETVIGRGIAGRRDQVVLSSKKTTRAFRRPGSADPPGELLRAEQIAPALEASLKRLGTDRLEVYHLHGVDPADYRTLRDSVVPELERLRTQGKIRFLGITERFEVDPSHRLLSEALADGIWDVAMVGFNPLNQSARRRVFPLAWRHGVGLLGMFAVRRALSQPERLKEVLAGLARRGKVPAALAEAADPLGFLVRPDGSSSITEAAYRYSLDEPGLHVVLSGTGNVDHLRANIAAVHAGPLPASDRARLDELFAKVDDVTGG